jgi:hypothetical protein
MDKTRYNNIDEKSKTITDVLGMTIDKGVRELVVLLNYRNIGTTASCWGHKNRGLPYPWVDIHNDHKGDIVNLISDLDIEVTKFTNSDDIRILPKTKDLIGGRKTFNILKNKLKK